MSTTYHEVVIRPCAGGFGEYERGELGEGWADAGDLIAVMADSEAHDLYEFGRDTLPDGVEDIRGRIRREPGRIFAVVGRFDGAVTYVGIVERIL